MAKQAYQKLELTWIGKGEEPKLEPRILIENPEYSYGDPNAENMLIHGDNLLALKTLEQNYAGKVKCVFIDPPYNTGSAFEHYDDGIEHSIWLNLISHRLTILHKLLKEDGLIWISLDDNEAHYCKVLCDEIFGRKNFLADVIWEKADSPRSDAKYFSSRHDHILVYTKNIDRVKVNRSKDEEVPPHYNKKDKDGRDYYLKPLRSMGADGHRHKRPSMYFPITAPDGRAVFPKNPDGSDSRWQWGLEKVNQEWDRIEFIPTRNEEWSVYFKIFYENTQGSPPETIWPHSIVGSNRTSKKEIKDLFGNKVFDTPKPEALVQRIIEISTSKYDIVLDSFLGSGTTAAVAHKMGRRWIGVELGEHAKTHCFTRLKAVVDGEQGGISKAVNWQGGGGFKFYTLAPSLLNQDQYGNWVISKEYNAQMLAAAMAKQEGFRYEPDAHVYWKQARSTEKDFMFTTTQFITVEMLDKIHADMQPEESLLIACKSYQKECKVRHANISIKKIPHMLLGRCEFSKDDYSFNIVNMPVEERDNEEPMHQQEPLPQLTTDTKKGKKAASGDQPSLFDK